MAMIVYILKDKFSSDEYKAIPFIGPTSFSELEKFVGGDAEFREGEVIVATKQGPLKFKHNPEDGATWIVENIQGEFLVFTSQQAMVRFTPVGQEADPRG